MLVATGTPIMKIEEILMDIGMLYIPGDKPGYRSEGLPWIIFNTFDIKMEFLDVLGEMR